MALTTRTINISLRFPTAQTTATVRFIPDLAAGDAQVLLEKYYDAVLTDAPKSITGATNASPIVITAVAHGYLTGERVTISGVTGNTAANGTWQIIKLTDDTFSLTGSTGNGAYVSGGTVTSTTIDGTIDLPVFADADSYINYRVQFPRESGVNEHYISVNSGTAIDLSVLLAQSLAAAAGYNLDLDSLKDVEIGALANNQALIYESATNLWKNKPITATTVSLGLTNGSVLFTDGNVIQQDNANFYWSDALNRLGIRTNTPASALHVQGNSSVGQLRLTETSTLSSARLSSILTGILLVEPDALISQFVGSVKVAPAGANNTVSAVLHAVGLTEQLRLAYDDSNYFSTTVNNAGAVTLNAAGASAGFTFSDNVTVPQLRLTDLGGTGYLTFRWNETAGDNTLNFKVNGGDRTLNLNGDLTVTANNMVDKTEQVAMIVRNDEATTLTVGEMVYVSGASGEHVEVKRALAINDPLSANTLGMVIESIASGADGKIALHGIVTGVNTNAYNEGDALYLSPSVAGGLTTTQPHAPDHMVFVGWVTKKAGSGKIALHIQNGYEIAELHDVYITSPAANHFLVYDATAGQTRWENRSPADARTALGLGTLATQNGTFSGTSSGTNTGDQNVFSNVKVGATTITANTTTDTLELIAGSNITLTPSGDTVTIASTATGGVDGSGTTNQLTYWVDSDTVGALTTATYPSLTELSYVKGVTSAIQTQITAKFTLPSLTAGSVLFSDGSTIAQDNANLFWDNSNDRLGIGTATPSYSLDVVNSARLQAAVGIFTAPTSSAALSVSRTVTTAYDGADVTVTQTGTGLLLTRGGRFIAELGSGGTATNSPIGVVGTAQSVSGSSAYSNPLIGGFFTADLQSGTTVSNAATVAVAADVTASVNANSQQAVRVRTQTAGTTTTTMMRGVNLAHLQTTSGSTTTTYRGLAFESWNVNAGATITNNSLIYADTTTNVGTTKYGLHFLPDMPSYHVGKLGLGSGVTAPTAQLQVRGTTEQLRVEYDASNYYSTTVNSAGLVTFDTTGVAFVFNDAVRIDATDGSPQLSLRNSNGTANLDFYVADDNSCTITGASTVDFTITGTGPVVIQDGLEGTSVKSRVTATASSASPTPDADTIDMYSLTALAANATFGAPTGTPYNGQKLLIRIKDNGTARTLNWNAAYVAGGASLPTTTVINKTMHLGFIYNTDNSLNKWMLIAKAEEA